LPSLHGGLLKVMLTVPLKISYIKEHLILLDVEILSLELEKMKRRLAQGEETNKTLGKNIQDKSLKMKALLSSIFLHTVQYFLTYGPVFSYIRSSIFLHTVQYFLTLNSFRFR